MKIKDFVQEVLLARLKNNGVLVVYDPAKRYHDLCLEMAYEKLRVIDASESSITSRADALAALQEFGQSNPTIEGILVYVPAKFTASDEEKQHDPFAIYTACGSVFPEGDGDEYLSLCLKARADHTTDIRRIFAADPDPSFDVIDAVGGGASWPNLQARLGVESPREILFILLTPTQAQLDALKTGVAGADAWANEVRALCQSTLGLKFLTKMNSWSTLADELWRYLLFSEFVFDLPVDLPDQLKNVPHSPPEARLFIEDLCDRLRNDLRTYGIYIERAEAIEQVLDLPSICKNIDDFGLRDTFPFEERACFAQATSAIKRDDIEKLRLVLNRHADSVWTGRGENQIQWALVQAASKLVQACEVAKDRLSENDRSLDTLIDYYISSLREVDRLQREFEQAAADPTVTWSNAQDLINHVRAVYRKLIDKLQNIFIRHLEKSGWPPLGKLANIDVFDQMIGPKLSESGRKVAVFLIDALRYELGVELAKQLDPEGQVEVRFACAQLPTITPVGMSSLLPEASHHLKLQEIEDKLVVSWDDQQLNTVARRMEVLKKRYGQRFAEVDLARFLQNIYKPDGTVELLIIRSNEMDNNFEANPEDAPGLISRTLQRIRAAIHKLGTISFQNAIIVTDHGFFLNTAIEPGDICIKPPGNWINVHERMLLGNISDDPANLIMSAEKLGIPGDFDQAAMPRAMVAYRAGLSYYHGGISLQEAVVPVISVRIKAPETHAEARLNVKLSYKHGVNRITTRRPVIELSVTGQSSFLGGEDSLDLMLEAQDRRGKVIGEAKPGGPVNPATGIINIKPGETLMITLIMADEFEGKFLVKAINPTTQAGLGQPIELETDYTV